ncbi:hypothetical protein Dimus_012094 [Dionaea muscipula]
MGRGGKAGNKRNSKRNGRTKGIASENSDEDYFIEEDETDDQLDELDFLRGGGRAGTKGNSKRSGRIKARDSGNSDEDYFVEEDDSDDLSDELDSLVADDTEGESRFEEDETLDEEEEVVEQVVKSAARNGALRPRINGTRRSTKRRRYIYNGEEGEDYDIEEEEEFVEKVVESKPHKTNSKTRKHGAGPRKRCRAKYEEDEDNVDCDEDDEEFTPDEIDSLDEEEEIPLLKKHIKKRGTRPENKKVSVKRRGRKSSFNVVKKSLRTKMKKRNTLCRKRNFGNDEYFIESVQASRGKRKRKTAQRRPKLKPGSDSDFVSSESSDYEFTISEEEREQVKEANEICRSLGPSLRTAKTIQKESLGRKGKEKAEDVKNSTKQVCGICLTEEGNGTVRGALNCCCHYFCFACIMEWSKVETRCPLCKQRFVTVSKHARSTTGIDLRSTVIRVAERNQVYQPSEDELRDYLDPYENVICTECHQGGDDALMLLCDVCDSPAHTYCVGLGREVPVGNWYCEGCRPSALGSANTQAQDLTPNRMTSNNVANGPSMFENMAEIDLNVTIPETPLTQDNGFAPSPRYQGGNQTFSPVPGVGVSTVFGRRRIHRQIHNILSTNRMNQTTAEFGGASASDLRGNLFGSQIDRGVESTIQVAGPPVVGTSQQSSYMGMSGNIPSFSAPGNDLFPGRIDHSEEQVFLTPTSVGGTVPNGIHCGRFGGMRMGFHRSPGFEQLHPCTSRLSIGASTSAALCDIEGEDFSLVKQLAAAVRSHLKSLSRGRELGYNTFEEIAESSKQTILAACGLEQRRNVVYQVQPPACSHREGLLANRQTSLIGGCCSSCFDSFVRCVVRTVMEIRVPDWFEFMN